MINTIEIIVALAILVCIVVSVARFVLRRVDEHV